MSRANYWSCGKFADWLRGTAKPHAETSKGWSEWNKSAKAAHPIRFWIAEEGLSIAQDFFMGPADVLRSIKYYINNRFISKSHALTAHPKDIKPGTWCDVGNRFILCLFNELVDYVEVELAWSQIAWNAGAKKKYSAPFWASGWWRVRTWRCKQAGLDNLEWQRQLTWEEEHCAEGSLNVGKPTAQAIAAQEILDLYTWWTVTRPARPDAYDASGWTALSEKRRLARGDSDDFWASFDDERTEEDREETRRALDLISEIEAKYEQEDEDMLIRLIKIRNSLWT